MPESTVIGIDIGGTHLRAALVSPEGNILAQRKERLAGSTAEPEQVCGLLIRVCESLMREATVSAVGLGVAGKISPASGRVLFSPNLPVLNGFPLAREVERRLGLPVVLENDANVFGIGENWIGAGRGIPHWVGVTLGTGVGGCLILNGRLWQGEALGFVGEIGHTVVDPNGPHCVCGVRGCLEAHASGRALVEGVKAAVSDGRKSALHRAAASGGLTPQMVYEAAKAGDPLALKLFERMGWGLGLALASAFSLLGIRHAIVGGGVSASWDLFIGPLLSSINRSGCMLDKGSAVVRKSVLSDAAALIGAARLALEARSRKTF